MSRFLCTWLYISSMVTLFMLLIIYSNQVVYGTNKSLTQINSLGRCAYLNSSWVPPSWPHYGRMFWSNIPFVPASRVSNMHCCQHSARTVSWWLISYHIGILSFWVVISTYYYQIELYILCYLHIYQGGKTWHHIWQMRIFFISVFSTCSQSWS